MIDKTADVKSKEIGGETIVRQFAVIMPQAKVGNNCVIGAHSYIDDNTVIGSRVDVSSGVRLFSGAVLENDVHVGPNVIVGSSACLSGGSIFPTVIRRGASIYANSVVLPGKIIGTGARIGAGSVITGDVPPNAIVEGNPGRIIGYVDTRERQANISNTTGEMEDSKVKGVQLHSIQNVKDLRGDLCAVEWEKHLLFTPKRAFFVYNVPNSSVRGEHAHRICHQFLLCMHGSISVVVDDGTAREEFLLSEPYIGIYIPAGVWGIQYKASADAILFVLASHEYDPDDYIRDYDEYLDFLKT